MLKTSKYAVAVLVGETNEETIKNANRAAIEKGISVEYCQFMAPVNMENVPPGSVINMEVQYMEGHQPIPGMLSPAEVACHFAYEKADKPYTYTVWQRAFFAGMAYQKCDAQPTLRENIIANLNSLAAATNGGSCTCSEPGDCEYRIGIPGTSIPGAHDGPDDTVDVYGKPNGWCWMCWKTYQIEQLQRKVQRLENVAAMPTHTASFDSEEEKNCIIAFANSQKHLPTDDNGFPLWKESWQHAMKYRPIGSWVFDDNSKIELMGFAADANKNGFLSSCSLMHTDKNGKETHYNYKIDPDHDRAGELREETPVVSESFTSESDPDIEHFRVAESLRAMVAYADIMARLKNISRTTLHIKLDDGDTDPQKTLSNLINTIMAGGYIGTPVGVNSPANLINWLRKKGVDIDHIAIAVNKPVEEELSVEHKVVGHGYAIDALAAAIHELRTTVGDHGNAIANIVSVSNSHELTKASRVEMYELLKQVVAGSSSMTGYSASFADKIINGLAEAKNHAAKLTKCSGHGACKGGCQDGQG